MSHTLYVRPPDIDRETGLSKDLLRKWRSRYGFPVPIRLEDGGLAYPVELVRQLRLIKRLLDGGFQPAMIVGKSHAELERIISTIAENSAQTAPLGKVAEAAIELLHSNDFEGLNQLLVNELTQRGLTDFVREVVAPLADGLGTAWASGKIEVYHEHFCTDVLSRLLCGELSFITSKNDMPRILFAPPPEERHTLGLLMAQAVLADQGAACANLGSHAPLRELQRAALAWRADIVGLSFSFAYPQRHIRAYLTHLRALLPNEVDIWIGGAGVAHIKRSIPGVRIFTDLYQPVPALQHWQAKRAGPA